MAQTKSATTKRATTRRTSARGGSGTSQRRSTKGRPQSRSHNGGGPVGTVKNALSSGTREVGRAAETTAKKAKTPLIAGGAAVAGMAGGFALAANSRRTGRRTLLGVSMPKPGSVVEATRNLASGAENVGTLGRNVGQLATEVRRMREEAGSAKRRSPIEVVLDGLTARREKA
jgi:hypothetical protein